MTAYGIVLLLGIAAAATSAHANQHGEQQVAQEHDSTEQGDIGDDAGLITDEFSYTFLFDQRYGVLVGFGRNSPRQLMHLEGLLFIRERLALSTAIGYDSGQNFDSEEYKRTAKTLVLSAKARYYPPLPLLPLSANASCGYVFWRGDITPSGARDKHSYRSHEAYCGLSFSAYYFWKTGIYVESVIYGISTGKAFGLNTAADKHRSSISKNIEKATHYGIFGGGILNVTVGYML